MINKRTLNRLSKYLSKKDIRRLQKNAEKVNQIEQRHRAILDKVFKDLDERIEHELMTSGRMPNLNHIDFELFFGEMIFQVMAEGLREVKSNPIKVQLGTEKRLAKKEKWRWPRSFKDLMELYDDFRKERKLPAKIKRTAESVKKEYLKKTQSVWRKYADGFLRGDIVEKKAIVEKIQKAADTTKARATTIVNTETTNHYNKVRVNIYEKSPDVTHFYFAAVRDAGTTPWCDDKNKTISRSKKRKTGPQGSGRGRGGLIFKKGTKLYLINRPSCHYGCRSELLPLSPLNPAHAKLINDESLWAENHKLFPLLPGWVAGTSR